MAATIQHIIRCLALGVALAGAGNAAAQTLPQVQAPEQPLVLKAWGSFFVGGHRSEQSPVQISAPFGPPQPNAGHVTNDKLYVQFMVPAAGTGVPMVMLHGATLTGKTYETTPDGRMGWMEYFVRRGHPTYVPDQVGRARSGFDPSLLNDVRAGLRPASSIPNVFRFSDELGWTVFRFGPSFGIPFPDQQFPVQAAAELARQSVPDLFALLPDSNPNLGALSELASQVNGAVVMGHSQSGNWPADAALADKRGIKGVVLVEPGLCGPANPTDGQIAALVDVPMLVVFGDHLDSPTGLGRFSWKDSYDQCNGFIKRMNAAGGNATMLYPPALGIHGNSHMIMQDRNNLQIADLILQWIDHNVRNRDSPGTPRR